MPRYLPVIWLLMMMVGLPAWGQSDGYTPAREAMDEAYRWAEGAPDVSYEHLAETERGGLVSVFTLAGSGDPDGKPGVLLVAGLDGRHRVGPAVVLRMLRDLAAAEDLLDAYTVYAIALANPDGAGHQGGHRTNLTAVDDDRDGRMDEDPPRDVNGDGFITQMRRLNPPLDDPPTHMADPAEPRLLKKRDALEGERAAYTVYTEGIDADDDGLIAEDGLGGVDVNRNFPQQWAQYDRDAGAYPLSSVEANAIAQFVIEHKNIALAVVYGTDDNIVNPLDGKGKDATGQGPKNVDPADAKVWKKLSAMYTETTGHSRAAKRYGDGSLASWLYAQRGIPTVATQVWGRPDAEKGAAKDDGADEGGDTDREPATDGGDPISGTWSATLEVPEMGEMELSFDLVNSDGAVTGSVTGPMGAADVTGDFGGDALTLTAAMGPGANVAMEFALMDDGSLAGAISPPEGDSIDLTAVRVDDGGDEADTPEPEKKKGKDKKDKPSDAEAAAWLKYSDEQRDGEGFVEWTAFDHPTLGAVEIGGFVEGFRMNPPADQLDDLAAKQAAFLREAVQQLPRLVTEGPVVKELAPGLYDIRFAIVNDGFLPTKTAQAAKSRATLPTIMRLSTPVEQIVTGSRVTRAWTIEGSGGRFSGHWIVRAEPGERLTIEIVNSEVGLETVEFRAEEQE